MKIFLENNFTKCLKNITYKKVFAAFYTANMRKTNFILFFFSLKFYTNDILFRKKNHLKHKIYFYFVKILERMSILSV